MERTLLPRVLDATLTVRVGKPLGSSRGGWRKEITFDLEEGYAVFREKCLMKLAEVAARSEVAKKQLQLHDSSDIYLKRANNDSQSKYVRLSEDSFQPTLQLRWRLLQPKDRQISGKFRFQAFLYVRSTAQAPAAFHRAIAARIKRDRVQRMAHEAANSISFGPIAAHHLDIVQARRPDSTPFEVPEDNTTPQAMELDRQRERSLLLEAQRVEQAEQDSPYAYTVTDPGESPFTFKNIMAVTIDEDTAMKFCMRHGLLARVRLCKHCDREMTLHVYHAGTDEEDRRWRCCRSGHPDNELSVRSGSFFSRGRLLLSTTLRLMLFWASGLPVGRALEFLVISNKTAIDWWGGVGHVVEIDETSLKKKSKFGRGRQHEDHWLFGGVDRNTGRWFGILTYSDRKKKTLSPTDRKAH
ncbi:hypothetical protein PHMEG_0002285 [Phytophthora megakarya]|uniref:Transposase n=1 Tax=Phytophthora megakarya TaxID=4795 RepID=A0A225WYL7_9STRA|nr:hypothetical protein PHMEG_0002285 [Phytophthora megakarya]